MRQALEEVGTQYLQQKAPINHNLDQQKLFLLTEIIYITGRGDLNLATIYAILLYYRQSGLKTSYHINYITGKGGLNLATGYTIYTISQAEGV